MRGIVLRTGKRTLRGFLTFRAEVGRAACQANLLDRRLAAAARLAGPTIGAKLFLVAALQAGAADVIADAGATFLDATLQNRRHGQPQAFSLFTRQFLAWQGRRQPGL